MVERTKKDNGYIATGLDSRVENCLDQLGDMLNENSDELLKKELACDGLKELRDDIKLYRKQGLNLSVRVVKFEADISRIENEYNKLVGGRK